MSAGSFILACMQKTSAQLRAALNSLEKVAADHSVDPAYAKFAIEQELHRGDRKN